MLLEARVGEVALPRHERWRGSGVAGGTEARVGIGVSHFQGIRSAAFRCEAPAYLRAARREYERGNRVGCAGVEAGCKLGRAGKRLVGGEMHGLIFLGIIYLTSEDDPK